MTERSPLIGIALLFAPTLCVGALRFGLPNIETLLKEDLIAQAIIHGLAILLGIVMFLRYRVVEDHEYHRSSAIKNLSSMYRLEDKGLWNRGDDAIDRLEAQAHNQPKGRAGLRFQQRMTGKVSDLNKEQSELYLERDDSRMEIDVQVEGMATIVDSEVADEANPGKLTGTLGASAEASAQRRLNKEIARREKDSIRSERQSAKLAAKEAKAAAKAEKAAAKAAAKAEKAAAKAAKKSGGREATQAMWDAPPDNQWETPLPSSLAESVISCQECGAVNSSGTAYCSSCGTFL
ncbi:MAG: zinc ribbon domain-containing protein [Candidatus Thalassarchaeaceae archaeon]|jgi:hypothetical protein|nr:zinc ribbon domain-containing protein [Candidatus Thalassarchaeaceae archaeon]